VVGLVHELSPEERLRPGYYRDPDWSVRDMVGHLGTWLAEAAQQFEQMQAGTYGGHDIDIDALNATFLAAMQGQPWDVAWTQANAGRTRMRQAWTDLPGLNDGPPGGSRKSAVEHYAHTCRAWEWGRRAVAARRNRLAGGPGAVCEAATSAARAQQRRLYAEPKSA
jgi:hypothetical protein